MGITNVRLHLFALGKVLYTITAMGAETESVVLILMTSKY